MPCHDAVIADTHYDWFFDGERNLTYTSVLVPDIRPMRKQVFDVSGQYFVPVLTTGSAVLTETHDILEYLDTVEPTSA